MSTSSLRRSDEDTQPIPIHVAPAPTGLGRHAAPPRRRSAGGWLLVIARETAIIAAVVALAVVFARLVVGQVAYVADDAMEPALTAGDRVLVASWGEPAVGDVVLVRSPQGWGSPADTAVVRVAGLGGDRVTCCDESGRVTVNGVPLDEPYRVGDTDQVEFDVVVPEGRVFVLADRRATARDSRAMLATSDGTLPRDDIIGRVVLVAWPPRGSVN